MSISATRIASASIPALLGSILSLPMNLAAQDIRPTSASIEEGRALALNRVKGNCVVCHMIPGAEFHGDIAPPLVAIKDRFPDKARLRAQVYDATKFNVNSVMPPFGRHQILTDDEIDKVVEWLLTL